MYTWTTKIQYVKGIGTTRAKELNKIGIHTVLDLIEYQPNHYIYPGETPIGEAKQGHVIVKAKITAMERLPHRPIVIARLNDGTGTCKAIWYNQRFVANSLRVGMTVTMWGQFHGGVLHQPRFTTCQFKPDEVCGWDYGVHTTTIRAALREVLSSIELPEMYGGDSMVGVFRAFHFPATKQVLDVAKQILKYDELLLMQLAVQKRKKGQERIAAKSIEYYPFADEHIRSYFSYQFTPEQKKVIDEVIADMVLPHSPMSRLLQGEVGSGKTAVAFYAAMLTALNHKRTLILCPTTILASQHYETLREMGWDDVMLWENTGPCSIGGSLGPPLAHIIVGTHAILNNESLLKSASLDVVDQFQKFGVEQRARIQKHNPHLLLMSATPIPRTMMMSVFGALDVSTIRELPIQRGTVITRLVLPDRREQMYEIIEKELAKGKQVYVVFPRIDGGEDVVSAEKGFEQITKRFSHLTCLLTGRAAHEDKIKALQFFREGHTKILVSTIIAEVGLDNPNASVMVIEGADRFGLSQLHQLRGRICRSTDTTFCFLVAETANQTSIDRLEVIEKCNDGFEIAEHDLRLRGPGEMFSTRQSGLPDLKFASLIDDYDLLVKARDIAADLVDKLDEPENAGLKEMLEYKYNDTLQLGGTV